MNVDGFPGCCGAICLKDFGNTLASLHTTKHSKAEIDKFVKFCLKTHSSDAFILAITNSEQRKAGVDNILRDNGFRSVAVGTNSGHHRSQPLRVWIYTYPLKMDIKR